jgi:hypothetical protein
MNHSPHVNSVFFKDGDDDGEGMLCVRYDGHGVAAGEEVCLNYRTVTDADTDMDAGADMDTDAGADASSGGCESIAPPLVGADYDLFSYGFCPPSPPPQQGSPGSLAISLPRDMVRAVLLADLDAGDTAAAAGTPRRQSPAQARLMAVACAACDLSIRLGGTFRVYEDGIDGHLMMALRLLAFASSSDLTTNGSDGKHEVEDVVASNRYDVPAMGLLCSILDDTVHRIDGARQEALDLSMSSSPSSMTTTAVSLLSMLARSKISIGQGCKSWAEDYRLQIEE